MKNRTRLAIAGVLAFALSFVFALKSAPAQEAARFDHAVRTDFFAGFAGNKELLARGMAACEKTLAGDPNHAEALVWHGAGLYYQGGQLRAKEDSQRRFLREGYAANAVGHAGAVSVLNKREICD